jgi:ubiquinone/menaquinone biosynthesis C-methylase UbiE
MGKPILDACCGGRMFWFDKQNPHVLFCDNREFSEKLCDGRLFEVEPDMIADFTQLPFDNETFWHIVFDPPHIMDVGETSWLAKKYGRLPKNWKQFIKSGFDECWRVLKTNGTLVFKWNESSVTVGDIIKAIDREPLYGQKERKSNKTHWLCFVKLPC